MKQTSRIRLEFLDGLRGLAALYVFIGHAYVAIREHVDPQLSPALLKLLKLIDGGHFAVAVFIVLSGYCLMLPIARTSDGALRGGWWEYIKRRARRIMPPYYAGLVLALILLIIFPQIVEPGDLSPAAIISHILLVHNLNPATILTINGPMWSVAMEWQIYFLLPFILLPVWRRWGTLALLIVGVALGMAPRLLLPASYNFNWTYPWYIGLFTMGMVGAIINFSPSARLEALRHRVPWGLIVIALMLPTAFIMLFRLSWAWQHLWFIDSLLGLTTVSFIIYLTYHQITQTHTTNAPLKGFSPARTIIKMFDARWAAVLGSFSYSLYLIHEPIMFAAASYLPRFVSTSAPILMLVQYLVVSPLIAAFCYLFYLVFERPFVSQAQPQAQPRAIEGAVSLKS